MEQWEKELREKLEAELPDGMYRIGMPPMVAITGKQGKINFEVMLMKVQKQVECQSEFYETRKPNPGVLNQIDNLEPNDSNNCATSDDIVSLMRILRNKSRQ